MRKLGSRTTFVVVTGLVGAVGALMAFPPVPPASIFGLVRDQYGIPLQNAQAQILFTAVGSTNSLTTAVAPNSAPDENYFLSIPMDAGLTGDLYSATAMLPAVGFRLSVKIGSTVYVPIEMQGNLASLGKSGSKTRIDLTLGVSSNNDGLPDAWKLAVIQQLGLSITPGQIHPGDLAPGTGLTYYQLYISGTYYLSPANGFVLNVMGTDGASSLFSFTGVKGHTYTVQAASELNQWTGAPFSVIQAGVTNAASQYYISTNTSVVNITVPPISGAALPAQFYRLLVD